MAVEPNLPGPPAEQKPKPTPYMALGTALGVAVGAALGVATDDLALWMGVGVALGVSIGAGLDASARKKAGGGS